MLPNGAYEPYAHNTSMWNARGAKLNARARKYSRLGTPGAGWRYDICVTIGVKMCLSELLSRSYATGEWMFEHREAVLAPLGGETIAHSLIRPAHFLQDM